MRVKVKKEVSDPGSKPENARVISNLGPRNTYSQLKTGCAYGEREERSWARVTWIEKESCQVGRHYLSIHAYLGCSVSQSVNRQSDQLSGTRASLSPRRN